jgi:hypothetical protein
LQFKKKLEKIIHNPRILKNKLSGYNDVYKIKLRSSGFRLAYEVKDDEIVVLVLSRNEIKKKKMLFGCSTLVVPANTKKGEAEATRPKKEKGEAEATRPKKEGEAEATRPIKY